MTKKSITAAVKILGAALACGFIVACAAFMGWAVGGVPA